MAALLAGMTLVPALVHALWPRWVAASAVGAVAVSLLFAAFGGGLQGEVSPWQAALAFAAMWPASFVVALGVGIPFKRRRDPRPWRRLAPYAWIEGAVGFSVLAVVILHAYFRAAA